MKKKLFTLFFAVMLTLAIFVSCSCAPETMTQMPEGHVFNTGDEIHLIDFETRVQWANLTLTEVVVLSNQSFEVDVPAGYDEEGEIIYTKITYNQIIQVFYLYEVLESGARSIGPSNFTTRDGSGYTASGNVSSLNPPAHTPQTRDGQASFVVALRNTSTFVNINFYYRVTQIRATALIKMDFPTV